MFGYFRGLRFIGGLTRLVESYGSDYRRLFKLGIPVMVTQLGVIVVSFADTMMVAAYDTNALAASAFVNSIFIIAIVMQMGFAAGLTPLVGALFSRDDKAGIGSYLKIGIAVNAAVALAFTILLGILWFFIDRLGQPVELMPLVKPYYLVVLATLLPMAIFNTFQQTSNGCTDTMTPMTLIIAANVLNVVGNYALIFGHFGMPRLGLLGAGLSTLISRLLMTAAIILIYRFKPSRRQYLTACRRITHFAKTARQIWVTSYPVMIQSGVECFLWTFGAIVSGWYGTVQLASYQIVNTIAQLGFMIYMGFAVATSIRVANLTGLGDTPGVRHTAAAGMHMTLLLAVIMSLVLIITFKPLVLIFTPDAVVVAACLPLLVPLILYQLGDALQLTYANAIRGTSCVSPLLRVAIIAYIVVGVPLVYFMAVTLDMRNVGVYYSFTGALMVAAILYILSFRKITGQLSD